MHRGMESGIGPAPGMRPARTGFGGAVRLGARLRAVRKASSLVEAKHVADVPDRLDKRGLSVILLDLSTQPANLHVDTPVESLGPAVSRVIEKLFSR